MEILNFLKWQWNRCSEGEKGLILVTFITILATFIAGIFFGVLYAIVAFIITLPSTGLLAVIVIYVANLWRKYKEEQEYEAQKIVDRLSGRSRSGLF